MNLHTQRQRQRQTDRQTERQTHIQTQTHRKTIFVVKNLRGVKAPRTPLVPMTMPPICGEG